MGADEVRNDICVQKGHGRLSRVLHLQGGVFMNHTTRKTVAVTAGLVMAVCTVFSVPATEMPAVTDMQADAFQSMGSGVTSADIPDMSGNLFSEMPSDTTALPDASSVEMPDMSASSGDMSLPAAGSMTAGQENTAVADEKKKEASPTDAGGTASLSGSTQMNNPFSGLADSVVGNLSFDADGYLSQLMGDSYGGLNSSLFNMEMPDVSFSDLNTQFAQMKASMDLKTSTISMELPEFSLNTTSATNAKELFGQTYGDLTKGMGVKNYSIPSSFNADAFLQKGFAAQASTKKAFEGTASFKNANSYIGGASDIVKEATGKLSTKSAFDRIGEITGKANGNKSKLDSVLPDATFGNTGVGKWVNGKKSTIKKKNNSAYEAALAQYEKDKAAAFAPKEEDEIPETPEPEGESLALDYQ